jgi:hypothetical protein
MTKEERAEARRLVGDATPGPWVRRSPSNFCTMKHQHSPSVCDYRLQGWHDERPSDPTRSVYVATEIGGPMAPCVVDGESLGRIADLDFIASARTLVPALLDESDTLRAKLARAVEALNDAERMIVFGHNHAELSGRVSDLINATADVACRIHSVLAEIGDVAE